MTAKLYLKRIKILDMMINHRLKQAEDIRDKAFTVSAIDTTKERIQSSPSADGNKYIERYVDLMNEIDDLIDRYVDSKNIVINQIHNLDNEKHSEVLYLRYVEYLLFNEIAVRMHYTKDYIWKLHREALNEFEKQYSKYLLN